MAMGPAFTPLDRWTRAFGQLFQHAAGKVFASSVRGVNSNAPLSGAKKRCDRTGSWQHQAAACRPDENRIGYGSNPPGAAAGRELPAGEMTWKEGRAGRSRQQGNRAEPPATRRTATGRHSGAQTAADQPNSRAMTVILSEQVNGRLSTKCFMDIPPYRSSIRAAAGVAQRRTVVQGKP